MGIYRDADGEKVMLYSWYILGFVINTAEGSLRKQTHKADP